MHKRLPPLNALRAFEAAARLGSLSKAAAELYVTQAAISHQVKLLEEYLGEPLFYRQARKLHLTDLGRAYLPILSNAFSTLLNGTHELFDHQPDQLITLRASASFAQRWLAPRLHQFHQQHPTLRIRLLASVWRNTYDRPEGVDVEITSHYEMASGLRSECLTQEQLILVASPAFIAEHPFTTIEELLQLPTISILGYRENWQAWLQHLGSTAAPPIASFECDSTTIAMEAAIHGAGLLLARSFNLYPALQSGRLVQVHEQTLDTSGGHYLVFPDKPPTPTVEIFCEWLKEAIALDQYLKQDPK